MRVTRSELRALYDYEAEEVRVRDALDQASDELAKLFRFMVRYASWNGDFGSGVASLAGKIGRARGIFTSPESPVRAIADRSVRVASYFFDAARDEFDDRETLHRDTHRCLAQALLQGIVDFGVARDPEAWRPERVAERSETPVWLAGLHERVASGYGVGSPDTPAAIFRSMGYHVGSEVLADREFSVIDARLRERHAELHAHLRAHEVHIGGDPHGCYQWIGLHSGHGGGAEADHFAWAIQGVERAFGYVDASQHPELRHQLDLGFLDFVSDHREFFSQVNR